jgi:hypothetical protein
VKKVTQKTPEFGLCIDWETSGSVWGGDSSKEYQGLTFGAIIFRTADFSPIEKIYREIKFNTKYKWSAEAEGIHGKTREHLEAHGVSQQDAATDLLEFITKVWPPTEKIMFLGHNPLFDIRFTNQLLNSVGFEFSVEQENKDLIHIPLHHVVLDTSALGFITLGFFKSDLLFNMIGGDEWKREKHNALNDAEMTLETCKVIKQLVNFGLGR